MAERATLWARSAFWEINLLVWRCCVVVFWKSIGWNESERASSDTGEDSESYCD
jgi:hypothetical protein